MARDWGEGQEDNQGLNPACKGFVGRCTDSLASDARERDQ